MEDKALAAAYAQQIFNDRTGELGAAMLHQGRALEQNLALVQRYKLATTEADASRLEALNDSYTTLQFVVKSVREDLAIATGPVLHGLIQQVTNLALGWKESGATVRVFRDSALTAMIVIRNATVAWLQIVNEGQLRVLRLARAVDNLTDTKTRRQMAAEEVEGVVNITTSFGHRDLNLQRLRAAADDRAAVVKTLCLYKTGRKNKP